MTSTVVAAVRRFLIRSLAVGAVVLTYALGNIGTHVLSVVGISTLAVTTMATPADAWYRRRFFRHRRFFRRRRY
jgi:hypothetical protein